MPKHVLRRSTYTWLSLRLWKKRLIFWSGALAIGLVAILFALGSDYAHDAFQKIAGKSLYLPLIVSPLGLALVVYLTRRFFAGSEGSGIPQTIAAIQMSDASKRNSVLSLKIAIGKIFLTLIALATGASVGREGPTVQIGASIMHSIGKFGHFSRLEVERSLILAGGAAGVAAAFNTPLAGVVFAIEEMSRSFEHRTSGTVLTAVIVAGITSLALLGNYTYFGHTTATLVFDQAWGVVLVCGLVGGIMGGIFSRALIASVKIFPPKYQELALRYPVRFAALCGLALAIIGILSGGTTYGTGYYEARQILEGTAHLPETYGILKMLATIVSYLSGIPGGIFAPSLAIGAGFGANLSAIFPDVAIGAIVTLGMVAYFAGVVQAPITAFVIVMEMTDNHTMAIPLMATALLAYATSHLVCPTPLYKSLSNRFLGRVDTR